MLSDVLFVLVLVLFNGFLSLSEIAIVSSRRARLTQMARTGIAGATRALALASDTTRFLSSVQVGITSIGILSGAIGEATLAAHARQSLSQVPALAPYAEPLALTLTVLAITYISLVLGELVPKRLALTSPERLAAIVARPMQLIATVFRPVVHVLSLSTDGMLRLLGVRSVERTSLTVEEIKVLIEQSTREGVLEPTEHEMVTNVLNLDERLVSGVLTPRSDIVYLDLQDSGERNRERLREEPHDVLPLCDGGLHRVVGFIRVRRVLQQMVAGEPVELPALAEPPLYVPETMSLMTALEQFRRTRLPAALVIDEFGEVEGIVSLTDIVAAIVGDLPSEEGGEPTVVRRADGSWLLDGSIDVDTLVRTLGDESVAALDRQDYHTLGGLAMVLLERVPRIGDVFERGRFRFEIVDMDGNRVDRVLVQPIGTATEPPS
jgi:putative hemolysin